MISNKKTLLSIWSAIKRRFHAMFRKLIMFPIVNHLWCTCTNSWDLFLKWNYVQLYAKVSISFTWGKHLHDRNVSQRGEVWDNKTSFTTPLLLKCLYQIRNVHVMYLCVSGIYFVHVVYLCDRDIYFVHVMYLCVRGIYFVMYLCVRGIYFVHVMYLCVGHRYQACTKLGKWAVMYLCVGHRYQACTKLGKWAVMYLCVWHRYQACTKLGKWPVMYLCVGYRYQACTKLGKWPVMYLCAGHPFCLFLQYFYCIL